MCLCQPGLANWPCKTQILNGASQRKKPGELILNQTLLQKFSLKITFILWARRRRWCAEVRAARQSCLASQRSRTTALPAGGPNSSSSPSLSSSSVYSSSSNKICVIIPLLVRSSEGFPCKADDSLANLERQVNELPRKICFWIAEMLAPRKAKMYCL